MQRENYCYLWEISFYVHPKFSDYSMSGKGFRALFTSTIPFDLVKPLW
jgi:hypothetical protein